MTRLDYGAVVGPVRDKLLALAQPMSIDNQRNPSSFFNDPHTKVVQQTALDLMKFCDMPPDKCNYLSLTAHLVRANEKIISSLQPKALAQLRERNVTGQPMYDPKMQFIVKCDSQAGELAMSRVAVSEIKKVVCDYVRKNAEIKDDSEKNKLIDDINKVNSITPVRDILKLIEDKKLASLSPPNDSILKDLATFAMARGEAWHPESKYTR